MSIAPATFLYRPKIRERPDPETALLLRSRGNPEFPLLLTGIPLALPEPIREEADASGHPGSSHGLDGLFLSKFAINKVSDALASGARSMRVTRTWSLSKTLSLSLSSWWRASSPSRRAIRGSFCKGFASYSYIYVHSEPRCSRWRTCRRQAESVSSRGDSGRSSDRRIWQSPIQYAEGREDVLLVNVWLGAQRAAN